ncbi:D-2-hydroxyacid dehydrogenase family protein [Roseomonas sp. OT10]|uniref:D-2-hydroxyacid dehydrogenase family protein n=1 Tax=Roseomonas cutis TaxID=2897332 RepID=UPI001E2CD70E|nr:D-2-hydroxyacid dehydrogenase family protein [Roseomonas sp. OT10]UFN47106.1 D-2-hydroxyacid dehydrogenase family protein [Roseomonas sp. OT10]
MIRCVVLDDYQDAARRMADWSALADQVSLEVLRDHLDPDAMAEALQGAAVVVAMRERSRFDAATLARLPALRLLVTTGMRNAAIDLAAAGAQGVVVCGTGSAGAPTPELAWGLLMALARSIPREDANFHAGGTPWQSSLGIDLAGKTLGIVGLGKVGQRMARYAAAFEMRVLAWSRNLTDAHAAAHGAERAASLDELLRRADMVTLHMVLGPETHGLIGARELGLMQPTALLVNTSRGPLVDWRALAEALRSGRIAGAALDVFDEEPLPPGHPLRGLPNLVATPHLGYVSEANYRRFFADAVEDIAAWLQGAPLRVLSPG